MTDERREGAPDFYDYLRAFTRMAGAIHEAAEKIRVQQRHCKCCGRNMLATTPEPPVEA